MCFPGCAFFRTTKVILTTVHLGSRWPGSLKFLDGCPKGCFDFRRPKDVDPLAVPAPSCGWGELLRRRVLYKGTESGL